MQRREHGFTIVELLIVIVVIAILAAITVVSYVGVRQNAETSAQKGDLSQLQRKIQLAILDETKISVDLKTPLVYTKTIGTSQLVSPLVDTKELTLYGVFDTTNNPAGSNWSTMIAMAPMSAGNNFRLRTGANTEASVRAFYETSTITNRDLTRQNILNTTGRHIGWVTANETTIISGIDNNADVSGALTVHEGWDFSSVTLVSGSGYTAVAALVFPEYHDQTTRTQVVRWLNKEFNAGL